MVVQWLRLCTSIAEGTCSVPVWGAKFLHTTWCGQKIKIIIISLKKRERERDRAEANELRADPSFLCLSASDQIFIRNR